MFRCTSLSVIFDTASAQIFDIRALLADDHTRTGRIDRDPALLVRTLDDDLG
jgi:hypothetical protein